MDQQFTVPMGFAWGQKIQTANPRPIKGRYKVDASCAMTYLRGDGYRVYLKLLCCSVVTDPTCLVAMQDESDCGLLLATFSRSCNLMLKLDTFTLFEDDVGTRKRPVLYQ